MQSDSEYMVKHISYYHGMQSRRGNLIEVYNNAFKWYGRNRRVGKNNAAHIDGATILVIALA